MNIILLLLFVAIICWILCVGVVAWPLRSERKFIMQIGDRFDKLIERIEEHIRKK